MKVIIAHEGKLKNACIVEAQDQLTAVVKYYEVFRMLGNPIGNKGSKSFEIAKIDNCDGLPTLKEETIFHYADLGGDQWLRDVEPIDNWIKYGHHQLTAN